MFVKPAPQNVEITKQNIVKNVLKLAVHVRKNAAKWRLKAHSLITVKSKTGCSRFIGKPVFIKGNLQVFNWNSR